MLAIFGPYNGSIQVIVSGDFVDSGDIVHSQLKEQYNRYMLLFVGLCLTGFLPLLTLVFLYFSDTGINLSHLGKHMVTVFVVFTLQVPLCGVLGYFMGVKRMEFLKRSTKLVKQGNWSEIDAIGLFQKSGQGNYVICCADIINDTNGEVERYWIIPSPQIEEAIKNLPELPEETEDTSPRIKLKSIHDPEIKEIVAFEQDGTVFFVSPPAKLF